MNYSELFSGVYTALVTPFKADKIAYTTSKKLLEVQIKGGVRGVVVTGTTGETPTLSGEERLKLQEHVIDTVHGRAQVIAGVGTYSTGETVKNVKQVHKLGADAIMVVTPYYNKPSQEGLFRHYSEVAEATDKPIIVYSIPSRCGIEMDVKILAKLYKKYPHVCAIKEAGGACNRVSQIVKELGNEFCVLSGDDALTLPFMAIGARGVISVASNLIPKVMAQMVDLALKNDLEHASEINKQYYPLFRNLFLEPNPVPIKHAMHYCGLMPSAEVRLPLCEMSADNARTLENTLKVLNLSKKSA